MGIGDRGTYGTHRLKINVTDIYPPVRHKGIQKKRVYKVVMTCMSDNILKEPY